MILLANQKIQGRIFLIVGSLLLSSCSQNESNTRVAAVETQQTQASEIPKGEVLYQNSCAACHSNPEVRAPGLSALNTLSPESLLAVMTNGKMVAQAAHLNDSERQTLANHLSLSASLEDPDWHVSMQCSTDRTFKSSESIAVAGWGLDKANSRYQPPETAGMGANDLADLELLWAQAFPNVSEMRSQPVLTSDTVFVGPSHSNKVYAFDLETGCVKWVYSGTSAIRSALSYGELPGSKAPFILYGDIAGFVHAINAKNGTRLWAANLGASASSTVSASSTASKSAPASASNSNSGDIIITGTPVHHKDRVYIPGSSFEVSKAGNPNYECCTKHGIVRAVNVQNGEEIWTYHTTDIATPQGKTSNGTQRWGPSGAPVWTTPAIDEKRNVLYIGTGENYSHPTTKTSDAIIALNLDTGEPEWVFQATENDAYNLACSSWLGRGDGPNCPENPGPDFDFGASVIIAKNSEGKDVLLAGQKSGDVWSLDPDDSGRVLWNQRISDGTPVGGIHWGMAVVGDKVFVPLADPEWSIAQWEYEPLAGMVALDISTGKLAWRHESNRGCFINLAEVDMSTGEAKVPWPSCPQYYGNSGAALGLDDMVLAGTLNGKLQAFSPENGSVIWEYDTKRPFDTLNGIKGHGGSLDNAGSVAIGNGYMVVQSGYSYINQMPGNVVLVFKKKTGQ
jgi:polyvinyl alcohol dehydrogenase (cytochrome)